MMIMILIMITMSTGYYIGDGHNSIKYTERTSS